MKSSTLFLIQSSYASSQQTFSKLQQLATTDDCLVLIGDAVLHAMDPSIQKFDCAIIETEQALLPAEVRTDAFNILSYADFAALCLSFNRIVTLK